VDGPSLIVAGPGGGPDRVAQAPVAPDMRHVPRMVPVVPAGRCILHEPAPEALPAPVDGQPLVLRGLDLVRAPASVRLARAQVGQAA
jgi:hypothetical protein